MLSSTGLKLEPVLSLLMIQVAVKFVSYSRRLFMSSTFFLELPVLSSNIHNTSRSACRLMKVTA